MTALLPPQAGSIEAVIQGLAGLAARCLADNMHSTAPKQGKVTQRNTQHARCKTVG